MKAFIFYIIIGIIAGFLAGIIRKGRGFGLIGNLVVGIGGAFVGGFLFRLVGFRIYSFPAHIIAATVGALILLWLVSLIRR